MLDTLIASSSTLLTRPCAPAFFEGLASVVAVCPVAQIEARLLMIIGPLFGHIDQLCAVPSKDGAGTACIALLQVLYRIVGRLTSRARPGAPAGLTVPSGEPAAAAVIISGWRSLQRVRSAFERRVTVSEALAAVLSAAIKASGSGGSALGSACLALSVESLRISPEHECWIGVLSEVVDNLGVSPDLIAALDAVVGFVVACLG